MGKPEKKGEGSPRQAGGYGEIWAVIGRIPRGRVATYGQVAALAGRPGQPRQAGYALHAMPEESELPWHRVINARGEVSPRSEPGWREGLQRHLLEEEGVVFDAKGRVDLDRYRWDPDERPGGRSPKNRGGRGKAGRTSRG